MIIKSAHDVVEEKFQQNALFNKKNSLQQKLIINLKENPIYNRSTSFNEKTKDEINHKNIYKPNNKWPVIPS